jgi:hypothetical protein
MLELTLTRFLLNLSEGTVNLIASYQSIVSRIMKVILISQYFHGTSFSSKSLYSLTELPYALRAFSKRGPSSFKYACKENALCIETECRRSRVTKRHPGDLRGGRGSVKLNVRAKSPCTIEALRPLDAIFSSKTKPDGVSQLKR